jgi:uncharacterized damage-inducible protein DinB
MGDRPSLRFVRDMLKMRRMGSIQLVLVDHLNAADPAWATVGQQGPLPGPSAKAAQRAAAAAAAAQAQAEAEEEDRTGGVRRGATRLG